MKDKSTPPIVNVLNMLLSYVTDLQYFFKKDFITKRYWKHFTYSIGIYTVVSLVLFTLTDITDAGLFFQLFLAGLLGLMGNALREGYLEDTKGYTFSWTNCKFGSYGSIVAALIMNLIWQ